MKRNVFLFILFMFLTGFILIGCNNSNNGGDKDPDPTPTPNPTLTITQTSYDLVVEETVTIVPAITNPVTGLIVTYTSDNEEIATVNANGLVTAIGEGVANITISLQQFPDVKVTATINVSPKDDPVEPPYPLTLTGPTEVYVGEFIQLAATDSNSPDNVVLWESSDVKVIRVDQTGKVTGHGSGKARIIITSLYTLQTLDIEITVLIPQPTSVEIAPINVSKITLSTNFRINAQVLPSGASQEVIWESLDEKIATIDHTGRVTPLYAGEVTIVATVKDTDLKAFVSFTVEPTPMEIISLMHASDPMIKYDVMFWGFDDPKQNQSYNVFGSVSNYFFGNYPTINKTSYWLAEHVKAYGYMDKVEYIVIHDTASSSGGAAANAGWLTNPGNTVTSWHYTVGNDGIFQSMNHLRKGAHAGDGTGNTFTLTDTGIKATTKKPVVSISDDGYWMLNGEKVQNDTVGIGKVPTMSGGIVPDISRLNDFGIYTEIGANGNYYIGRTWYTSNYGGRIVNRGGNASGIGIETAMNWGSDLFLTYHYTARLVANLLVELNLPIERVTTHHFHDGKPCPRTMLTGQMYNNFMQLIEAELLAAKYLSGYTITFTSYDKQYVNDAGRIIALPSVPTRVSYLVQITNDQGFLDQQIFYVDLPAKR